MAEYIHPRELTIEVCLNDVGIEITTLIRGTDVTYMDTETELLYSMTYAIDPNRGLLSVITIKKS